MSTCSSSSSSSKSSGRLITVMKLVIKMIEISITADAGKSKQQLEVRALKSNHYVNKIYII